MQILHQAEGNVKEIRAFYRQSRLFIGCIPVAGGNKRDYDWLTKRAFGISLDKRCFVRLLLLVTPALALGADWLCERDCRVRQSVELKIELKRKYFLNMEI